MSIVWKPETLWATSDSPDRRNRGAAAVGMLADLPPLERLAVTLLRHWCEGPVRQDQVAQDLIQTLGDARGTEAIRDLAALIDGMLAGARRPLMRHDGRCPCIGCDENAFANLVASATAGDHEQAMAFALVLMTPACAFEAVQNARMAGLAMLLLIRKQGQITALPPVSATRH
jgi:hypothetical protein